MKSIIATQDEVRGLLDGRKTMFRRAIKFPRGPSVECGGTIPHWPMQADEYGDFHPIKCPFGKVGDKLYVRESFHNEPEWHNPVYRATAGDSICRNGYMIPVSELAWSPSVHMTQALSRLTLEIVELRAERFEGKWVWVFGVKVVTP